MAIDFEIPPEAKAIRERVRQWVHDECIPAEKKLIDGAGANTVRSRRCPQMGLARRARKNAWSR